MSEPEVIQGVLVAGPATFKTFGITRDEWIDLLGSQGFKCAVCRKTPRCGNARHTHPEGGHLHVHHEHVKGWKKMPPEQRRTYVIALVCQFCNRFVLSRTMTLHKARNIVIMLERYEGGIF